MQYQEPSKEPQNLNPELPKWQDIPYNNKIEDKYPLLNQSDSFEFKDEIKDIWQVFNAIYTNTAKVWLSFYSWEKQVWQWILLEIIDWYTALLVLPDITKRHTFNTHAYTWEDIYSLKDVLKSWHTRLLKENITINNAKNFIEKTWDKMYIVVWNMHNDLVNIFKVAPHWKEVIVPRLDNQQFPNTWEKVKDIIR